MNGMLITGAIDRAGHDLRHTRRCTTTLKRESGWEVPRPFEKVIERSVRWYLEHRECSVRIVPSSYERY